MKTADIETKLSNAISNEVPDVLDSILSRCEAQDRNVIEISEYRNKTKNNNWVKSICATAAALALIVGGYFGIGQYQTVHTVESVISLDVNPSVKLEVNKDEKVLSATGINEDGKSILDGMEQDGAKLKGKTLEEAVNELVYAMVEEGYLSEVNNSILVSVINCNDEKSVEIKSHLLTSVSNALSEKDINGAIIGQTGSVNEKTSEIASQYNISEGKASLIEKIIAKSPQFTVDDLAALNINDLSLLAEKWIDKMDNISMIGTPSNKGYVTSDSAIGSACSHANITIGDNAEIGTSIKLEDGKLIYDVSVKTGNIIYEYVIDAKTGAILNWASKNIESVINSSDKDNVTNNVTDSVTGVIDSVTDSVTDSITDSVTGVTDSVTGVTDSITDSVTGVIDSVIGSVTDSINGNSDNSGTASAEAPAGQIVDNIVDIVTGITDKATGVTG